MSDAKYFTTTKKGEIAELRTDLRSDQKNKRKEAVKKVIANMTVGKDVGSLFPDVVNCIQTDNLELKKLVYLYVLNYAKNQQDCTLMSVNTFVKDSEDPNPLIRALAIRTMGCIRVDRITEHICNPLRNCLKDEDPYVRKTAAICVAKLYDINQQLVEDQGFLEMLKELLADPNPMVVANAVASLSEIGEGSASAAELTRLDYTTISKLLAALNECTEWGQVFILDSVSHHDPQDGSEAQGICERVLPRLSHANSAVVLSAVKVLMKYLEFIPNDSTFHETILKKLSPPLVTLLSAEPEIQYVALRNINLIVQKKPDIMKHEIKVFFVKYNDPIYVKLEKLDIMIRLSTTTNIVQVLAELKEYATEVDVDFVRKAVRAIGRCAIKVESSAERCVRTLLELIQTKVSYVVQEAVVVIRDIFRKYPNQYEEVIDPLCKNLDSLDEPEARASMIWIIGEYGDRIDNSGEILSTFVDGFQDENTQVQLQLLTAVVKLFLKRPNDTQELVQRILNLSTQESDNPDLRDRGYIYWRLLSSDPGAAKEVVLAEKPLISEDTDLLEPVMLNELINHIATLASVYHKPPSAFIDGGGPIRTLRNITLDDVNDDMQETSSEPSHTPEGEHSGNEQNTPPPPAYQEPNLTENNLIEDLLNLDLSSPIGLGDIMGGPTPKIISQPGTIDDLLNLGGLTFDPIQSAVPASLIPQDNLLGGPPVGDLFRIGISSDTSTKLYSPNKEVWLTALKGKGLEVSGTFSRRNKQMLMELTLHNKALQVMDDFALKFNKNSFALNIDQPIGTFAIQPGAKFDVSVVINNTNTVSKMDPLNALDVAIKNNIGVFIFQCLVHLNILFIEDGKLDPKTYLEIWKAIPDTNEKRFTIDSGLSLEEASDNLEANNLFKTIVKSIDEQNLLYATLKYINDIWVLFEFKFVTDQPIHVSIKSKTVAVIDLSYNVVENILKQT